MIFNYKTKGTCASEISFDIDGNVVRNIRFTRGCDGNLKAIERILEGTTVDFIEEKCRGLECGMKGTSCTDQLARAVREAHDKAEK